MRPGQSTLKTQFVGPKTRSGRRTIKLGEGVLQALREHLERQQRERAIAGERWVEHDLRHTVASLILNHGIPVIVVSKMLGHSRPGITMDIYGHQYNEMQDEAAQLMDEIVTPVQVELTEDRVIARSRQATKQSPHDEAEIASPRKASPECNEWERRARNDKAP